MTVNDLVILVKSNPGKYNFAGAGTGSPGHLIGEQFRMSLGGDRPGRMRLPLEIVEAVRREMPASIPLFLRVSSVGPRASAGSPGQDFSCHARRFGCRRPPRCCNQTCN
jgi:hypothetical protein